MGLRLYGWNQDFAMALAGAGEHFEAGRVVTTGRGVCLAWTNTGERELVLSGPLLEAPAMEKPVTGDWVAFEPGTGRIRAVLPRRTCLVRKRAGRSCEEQPLAANVDVLFVVMGLDRDFNVRRLERYLLLARESGADPVVVLNKSDLCADVVALVREVDAVTQAPLVVMSAMEAGSVRQLDRFVEPGQTAALAGSSGVGKSTIVNVLFGGARQPTAHVREHDGRGRHTTTSRTLFLLPEGWMLADLPGIRELEVWTDAATVAAAFADIETWAQACRFRDCRHRGEPGCAVAEAVAQGRLEPERLAGFHKLRREVDAQQLKRRQRIAQKAYRRMPKRG